MRTSPIVADSRNTFRVPQFRENFGKDVVAALRRIPQPAKSLIGALTGVTLLQWVAPRATQSAIDAVAGRVADGIQNLPGAINDLLSGRDDGRVY